jgi:transposase-like protein
MEPQATEPTTLQEAVIYFKDPTNCRNYLVPRRWENGVVTCPQCGSSAVTAQPKYNRWQCAVHHDRRQFTLKTGTIMEDSPIGLDKWMPAIWLLCSNRNGISSWELHRALGVTQKTAWFMLGRIRLAMQDDLKGGMLGGEVEVDESFIGGAARNMHKDRKVRVMQGKRGGADAGNKSIVLGILERASEKKPKRVRATIISDRKKLTMQAEIMGAIEKGANVYSDEFAQSWRDDEQFNHGIVNHLKCYVDGQVHTNGLENFWSLLKRGLKGTYISVEAFHLFRYVDEQSWRYNNRKHADGTIITDAERFSELCRKVVGKRLTYTELTGKQVEERPEAAF